MLVVLQHEAFSHSVLIKCNFCNVALDARGHWPPLHATAWWPILWCAYLWNTGPSRKVLLSAVGLSKLEVITEPCSGLWPETEFWIQPELEAWPSEVFFQGGSRGFSQIFFQEGAESGEILFLLLEIEKTTFLLIISKFRGGFGLPSPLPTPMAWGRCNQGRAFASPEIFKTLHSNFDICRNILRIKMKFYILMIFKKSCWNFSLSCSLIIFLQDLSCDRLSDRKFRKWLVFNHKYAGRVNLGDGLNCSYFKAFFIYLFVYYFFLDRPQFALMKLYNIRVLLNRANCWNFQIDKRNLDIAVSASSNRLFYDLLIIIFVRAKRITIINVVHFLKKRCLAAFSLRNLIVFN